MPSTPTSHFLGDRLHKILSAPTLSVDDTGEALGIGRSSAYAGIKSGEIPSFRVGRRVRVPAVWVREQLHLDGLGADESA